MSRRAAAPNRTILPDPKFNSDMLAKFMNVVMQDGKKSAAERILYGALERIAEKTGKQGGDSLTVLSQALDNVKPAVEVKSRRVGGATYQVPVEVPSDRQFALAMRWLVDFADARKGQPMRQALAAEILEAYQGQGNAIRKRDEVHKMAQANKAFAHFRW